MRTKIKRKAKTTDEMGALALSPSRVTHGQAAEWPGKLVVLPKCSTTRALPTPKKRKFAAIRMSALVTCARRPDASAAFVGVRSMWPLALMLCADLVPIESTHFRVR